MKIALLSDSYMPGGRVLDPFRAQLLKSLCRAADEVLYLQCNDFQNYSGEFLTSRYRQHVLSSIRGFNPDLILTLNRAGLTPELATQTKASVASWYIDNPNRFPDSLRRFLPDETVYCATRYMMNWLARQPSPASSVYLPFCTDENLFSPGEVVPESSKCDVSFVGTLWEPDSLLKIVGQMATTPEGQRFFAEGVAEYLGNYDSDFPQRLQAIFPERSVTDIKNSLDDFLSTRRRLDYLEALSDLELEIYGTSSWLGQSLLRSNRLFERFRTTPLETPEELVALYRRSRVAISVAHQQAQSGFPIRIFDVLATGVPLVSDGHSELDELFEEGKCFYRADSPEEASESVRRLLGDGDLARRMGAAGMAEVRAHHTFAQRLKTMTGLEMRSVTGKLTVVSDCFEPESLKPEFTAASVQVIRSGFKATAALRLKPHSAPVHLALRAGQFASQGARIGLLLSQLSLARFLRKDVAEKLGSREPVKDFLKNMVRQQSQVLSIQLRSLLVTMSRLKKENET